MSNEQLPNDIWKDPQVQEALRDGRHTHDICCLRCPKCDRLGYYNQGSTFSCRFCDLSWYVLSEDEEPIRGRPCMSAEEMVSLADTVTDCTDGYDNHTR
jgi:hypothetical protein